jgi:hypothetical protein
MERKGHCESSAIFNPIDRRGGRIGRIARVGQGSSGLGVHRPFSVEASWNSASAKRLSIGGNRSGGCRCGRAVDPHLNFRALPGDPSRKGSPRNLDSTHAREMNRPADWSTISLSNLKPLTERTRSDVRTPSKSFVSAHPVHFGLGSKGELIDCVCDPESRDRRGTIAHGAFTTSSHHFRQLLPRWVSADAHVRWRNQREETALLPRTDTLECLLLLSVVSISNASPGQHAHSESASLSHSRPCVDESDGARQERGQCGIPGGSPRT